MDTTQVTDLNNTAGVPSPDLSTQAKLDPSKLNKVTEPTNSVNSDTENLDPTKLNKVAEPNKSFEKAGISKILVVEDEADAREIFSDLLSTKGYNVISAVDGNDALAKIEVEKGSFDLILLDIIMPNKDGVETLQNIVSKPEIYGKPKVVMLTNIGGDAAVEKAIQLGAVGYMLKSETEPEQLLEAVDSYLHNKMPANPMPSKDFVTPLTNAAKGV